jgi:hypothetical protein
MSASCSLPIAQRPTVITVGCGWNVRLTSWNGRGNGDTSATPDQPRTAFQSDAGAVADRAEPDLTLVLRAVNRQSEQAQAGRDLLRDGFRDLRLEHHQHVERLRPLERERPRQ